MNLCVILLLVCLIGSAAFFEKRKRKEEDKKAARGTEFQMPADKSHDVNYVKDALNSLRDTNTMREIEVLMNDPDFVRQMEQIKTNPQYAETLKSAKELHKDSDKTAKLFSDLNRHTKNEAYRNREISDAELSMKELLRAGKDPKILSEALEMLKDSYFASEELMNDTDFQNEVQAFARGV